MKERANLVNLINTLLLIYGRSHFDEGIFQQLKVLTLIGREAAHLFHSHPLRIRLVPESYSKIEQH
jgi:hypothetical protein